MFKLTVYASLLSLSLLSGTALARGSSGGHWRRSLDTVEDLEDFFAREVASDLAERMSFGSAAHLVHHLHSGHGHGHGHGHHPHPSVDTSSNDQSGNSERREYIAGASDLERRAKPHWHGPPVFGRREYGLLERAYPHGHDHGNHNHNFHLHLGSNNDANNERREYISEALNLERRAGPHGHGGHGHNFHWHNPSNDGSTNERREYSLQKRAGPHGHGHGNHGHNFHIHLGSNNDENNERREYIAGALDLERRAGPHGYGGHGHNFHWHSPSNDGGNNQRRDYISGAFDLEERAGPHGHGHGHGGHGHNFHVHLGSSDDSNNSERREYIASPVEARSFLDWVDLD